jgi:hypothetical protein
VNRKSHARESRRAAFRATVAQVQHDTGASREQAATMLQDVGASWRDFGLAYTGFGSPELGPDLPNAMARAQSWLSDGVPFGIHQGIPQCVEGEHGRQRCREAGLFDAD